MTAANRPRLLDLFCGAGGAAMGYHRAGFDVVGVDIKPQPNYPFEFYCADALSVRIFTESGEVWVGLHGRNQAIDAIHASPPCQAFSLATRFHGNAHAATHPDLIAPTRELLEATGLPHVIENVAGAPIRHDLVLCGEMFGLRVHRHRYFQLGGFFALQHPHARHHLAGAIHNCHVEEGYTRQVAGNYADHTDASDAMGIDWMARAELAEAIPPAYTEFIGDALLAHVESWVAA